MDLGNKKVGRKMMFYKLLIVNVLRKIKVCGMDTYILTIITYNDLLRETDILLSYSY